MRPEEKELLREIIKAVKMLETQAKWITLTLEKFIKASESDELAELENWYAKGDNDD